MNLLRFTDKKQRTWDLSLDLLVARRIDNSDFSQVIDLDFSFLDPSKEFMSALVERTGFAMAIIWAIVQPQAKKMFNDGLNKELSDEELENEFMSGFDGLSIETAKECLWGSLGDFFPSMATVLSMLVEQKRKLRNLSDQRILESQEKIDSYMEREANKLMDEALDQLK